MTTNLNRLRIKALHYPILHDIRWPHIAGWRIPTRSHKT